MKNNFRKLLKHFSIVVIVLILSILIEIFGFNIKQFTLPKSSKGLINVDDYKISDVSGNNKSIDIKLNNKYVNKLVVDYSTKKDVPIIIKYNWQKTSYNIYNFSTIRKDNKYHHCTKQTIKNYLTPIY